MSGECDTYGGEEECKQVFTGETRRKEFEGSLTVHFPHEII